MTEREDSEPNTQALDHQSHNHPAIGKLRDKKGPDRRRRLTGTVAKQIKARQMALSASPEARDGPMTLPPTRDDPRIPMNLPLDMDFAW